MYKQAEEISKDLDYSKYYLGSFITERVLNDLSRDFVDEKRAKSLYEKWYKETGLHKEELLKEYLDSYKLSNVEFIHYIDKQKNVNSVTNDYWIHKWTEIIELTLLKEKTEINDLMEPMKFPFSQGVSPLLVWANDKLNSFWRDLSKIFEIDQLATKQLTDELLYNLCSRLTLVAAPSFTLEMHIDKLLNKLEGQNPKERYKNFINNRLTNINDINETLKDYPVLVRLLITYTENWINFISESVERFYKDKTEIEEVFQMSFDHICKIQGGLSDLHRKGKSVLVFHFKNGNKILYKPKPLGISKHFQELLSWINHKGFDYPFPIQKIMNKHEYGWEEFIDTKDCKYPSQVENFYYRQGGYLGILYLLEATDFHYDNIIASGEYPVLIDLESLFHHRAHVSKDRSSAVVVAQEKLDNSVARTQLLPFLIGGHDKEQGVTEVSGLGGKGGQQTPFTIMDWENIATDEMVAIRTQGETEDANNLPVLNGKPIEMLDYKENLLHGFERIYKIFMDNKKELYEFIRIFENDEIRQVVRPTYMYALLLEGGHHPDYLQNGMDRERLMSRLWSGLDKATHLKKIVSSEIHDLLMGDIPYFYTKPNSKDLWNSNGTQIEDFFQEDSFSNVQKRCMNLGYDDFQEQIEIIKASLNIGNKNHSFHNGQRHRVVSQNNNASSFRDIEGSKHFIDAALDIGNHLESKAIWGDDRKDVTWIGLQWMGKHSQWQYSVLDLGLYNGLSGMSFFMSYLAKITKLEKFKDLSIAALNSALKRNDQYFKSISAYQGNCSMIYTMMHLAKIWDDDVLLEMAMQEASKLKDYIGKDKDYDLLGGSAGAIIVFNQLYQLTADNSFLNYAITCGEHLIQNAQKAKNGHGWVNSISQRPVVGFSHGSSGIAWSLASLFDLTGDNKFKEMALQALKYERSLFVPEYNNWLDYRVQNDNQLVGVHWCNGAPGIGISRILMNEILKDEQFVKEIELAIQITKKAGFRDSHSLCHGDLGNMLFLQLAAKKLKDNNLKEYTYHKANQVLNNITSVQDWECGSVPGVQLPGLMLGLAGIGHGLLQLARPEEVPSPLYLESVK
ncbi:hypothetical protein CON65_03535 [Bacillus pseudomycoides]|uniref:Lantibiotic biosynthesis protein dehydration domain-containing protein n=1 Tax=Bacillus pseudomycoides TaxID=64104 RepID=A0AA91ZUS9_9BACI|nr:MULTISPECIES: type 2 lanthipeptide synthetase LanM family protein [Bacillus]PEB54355.1 hypothetical protein COO03_05745 [Bacillus sp. AFS098217]PED83964.1 hypothetical protein CON65_03535 [Bacillus pseudomycoides]PEU16634.1 hypothetical protein CN524_03895 [Bacillus sp. AFS019443]